MRKGFIERIEDNNVYVVFQDGETELFHLDDFKTPIKIDMQVKITNEEITVFPPSAKLQENIKKVTNKIFVPFNERKKR